MADLTPTTSSKLNFQALHICLALVVFLFFKQDFAIQPRLVLSS